MLNDEILIELKKTIENLNDYSLKINGCGNKFYLEIESYGIYLKKETIKDCITQNTEIVFSYVLEKNIYSKQRGLNLLIKYFLTK